MNGEKKTSSPQKSEAVRAALLSAMVVPGAGQLYNRQWGKGIAYVVLFLICSLGVLIPITLAVAGYYLNLTAGNVDNAASALVSLKNQWIHLGILVFATIGIYVYSIVDAYRCRLRELIQNQATDKK